MLIFKVIEVDCDRLPLVPFTLIVYVPVTLPAVIVMVDLPPGLTEDGLKLTRVPNGIPLADRLTLLLKPPLPVTVMVDVPRLPLFTVRLFGFAERLKSPLPPPPLPEVTVSETVVL